MIHREPTALTLPSKAHPAPAVAPPNATPLGVEESGIPWARHASAIWRYKWIVLLFTLVGAAVGVKARDQVRPTYSVNATLWVSSDTRHPGDIGALGELVSGSSWVDLLRSYAILERVARRAGALVVPLSSQDRTLLAGLSLRDSARTGRFVFRVDSSGATYSLLDANRAIVEQGKLGDSVGAALGFVWHPDTSRLSRGSEHPFLVQSARDAANDISARLTTVQPEGTSFIRLTLTGSEPRSTAALLNMITDEFIAVSTDLKKRSIVARTATLRGQASAAEQSLRAAENALARFRVGAIVLPSDAPVATSRSATSDPLLSRYLDDRSALDDLQRDRATIKDAMSRLRNDETAVDYVLALPVIATRAPEVRAAVVELANNHAALNSALRQFMEEHKTVRDLRAQERQLRLETIPRLAAARDEQLAQRERELSQSVSNTTMELQNIPPRALEELRLRRNVTLADNLFSRAQNEYEAAQLAAAGTVADVSVLDPAVPPLRAPSSRAQQLAVLYTGAGGFFGVFLALLLDATDKRLRHDDQIPKELGLFVLGRLPRLGRRRNGHSLETAELVEALRSIRVGIAYGLGGQMPMQIAVTSPNVGDGKSLVSANLAISFAEAGYRTLLIDCDIRRGEAHAFFGVARRPGLLDILATGSTLADGVVATEVANLSLLPSGTRYRQGPEMLAGPRLANLIDEARSRFDVVIVDTPPLGVGSDAQWASMATGAALIVLRLNASNRKTARSTLDSLERLPVRIVGAVLNDAHSAEQNDYMERYALDMVDLDAAIPQRTSRIGMIGSGR